MGKYGVKETKELIGAVATLLNAIGVSYDDGKFSPSDMVNFMGVLTTLPAGIDGIEKIPAEILDMDTAEVIEIKEFAKEKLDLPQEKIEEAIEDFLAVGLDIVNLAMKYKKVLRGKEVLAFRKWD